MNPSIRPNSSTCLPPSSCPPRATPAAVMEPVQRDVASVDPGDVIYTVHIRLEPRMEVRASSVSQTRKVN
jgi:hypothetical protein